MAKIACCSTAARDIADKVGTLLQSTVTAEAAPTDTVMVDQDPPIDPSVETAPHAEPTLPVSTMTGTSTGVVTSTPQLGPASPGVTQATTPIATQEITPVSVRYDQAL